MTAPISRAIKTAEAEALLTDDMVLALVARHQTDGPAVFAPLKKYADIYPRLTLEKPQVLPFGRVCDRRIYEVYLVIHSWAVGQSASLVCGDLADAAREVMDRGLTAEGWKITGRNPFQGQREAGDPDPTIEHLVSTFRFLVHRA